MDKNQEQKRERFKRLGTQRTNSVLQRLKVLGNCSNRSAYDYTEEEIIPPPPQINITNETNVTIVEPAPKPAEEKPTEPDNNTFILI
ncbi:MAG: hypothetical protein AAB465_03030, partial [Patescibacteria group bacterium]